MQIEMELSRPTLKGIRVKASQLIDGRLFRIVRFADAAEIGVMGKLMKDYPALRVPYNGMYAAVECSLDDEVKMAYPVLGRTVQEALFKVQLSLNIRYRELQKRLCSLVQDPSAADAIAVVLEMKQIEEGLA